MLRALFVSANPTDSPSLSLKGEFRAVEDRLRTDGLSAGVELRHVPLGTFDILEREIRSFSPNLLHFACHGTPSALLLEGDRRQRMDMQPEVLGSLIKLLGHEIRCLVLNACYSAMQADALLAHVPCLIGMQTTVSDSTAIGFSRSLYAALAAGDSISRAFELAQNSTYGSSPFDHGSPILYQRAGAGGLPLVQKVKVFCLNAPADQAAYVDLYKALTTYRRAGLVELHSHKDAPSSADVDRFCEDQLDAANVVLCLGSDDFLDDDHCAGLTLRALRRREAGQMTIISILIRPCSSWKDTPLGSLQSLPRGESPLTQATRDAWWQEVVTELRGVVRTEEAKVLNTLWGPVLRETDVRQQKTPHAESFPKEHRMGARFKLRHTNIVAYLTTAGNLIPRLRYNEMHEFLIALMNGREGRSPFISHDSVWPQKMGHLAQAALRKLHGRFDNTLMGTSETADVLNELREAYQGFAFFACAVGSSDVHDEVTALAEYLAYRSRGAGLVLIPSAEHAGEPLTILDPIPAFTVAIEQRTSWPGILFWTKSGIAAFASVEEAPVLFEKLLMLTHADMSNPRSLEDVLSSFRTRELGIRILHLSDLHYGRSEAAENEALLLAHLDTELEKVHRVVITGDLFDNPQRQDAVLFRNFRAALVRRTGKDPVVIPGNHDQKWLGNLPAAKRQVADLEWSSLVIDDELQCSFFCFDSSRDGELARGRVTSEQLRDVATIFETMATRNPRIREFLPVALIHHHPFSFEVQQETFVQRILRRFGLSDEQFMKMLDADQFLNWTAKRKIPLILHGHKHVQRHFQKKINVDDTWYNVSAVGCGTSLGAEGYGLSYNVLTWNPHSRSWSVSFFADPGDGSGFSRQCITSQDLTV